MEFIVFNGEIIKRNEIGGNFAFPKKNIELQQKIWFGHGGIPLFEHHIRQVKELATKLKLPLPVLFEKERELFRITKRMLNKNRYYLSGLLFLNLVWNQSQVFFFINAEPAPEKEFPFLKNGTLLNFSDHRIFTQNRYSTYEFYHLPLWQATYADIIGSSYGNSIILNDKDFICECAGRNLYLVNEGCLITPSADSGCYIDPLRELVLQAATDTGFSVKESDRLQQEELLKSEELFTASESSGIQWILGINTKRYLHSAVKEIHNRVDEILKEKVV